MNYNARVTKIGSLKEVAKQIKFAAAVALTQTAKDGQSAVISALRGNFTLRSQWYEPRNKIGIRIKPAKKNDLVAEVKTASNFLEKFETGDDKLPHRRQIAIPTDNVRRNKRDIITTANRPAALRDKRTVLLETKAGLVLFQRKFKGKRSKLVALYVLKPRTKTPKKPTFYGPIGKIVIKNFDKNFNEALKKALETAK